MKSEDLFMKELFMKSEGMVMKKDRFRIIGSSAVLVRVAIFLALLSFLSFPATGGCNTTQSAVISTVAPDYSSGAHSVVSVEPKGGPRSVQNSLLPTAVSDITVAAYENYFYRIERFQADNITKFDIKAPDTPIWQFSTLDDGETQSQNPHDLIFVNSTKAYLIRYGSTKAWIVNPSATTQSEFKTGELDLAPYADSDGIPEMNSGVIADGKLFIAMQRLDQNDNWSASNDSYVAIFDINTDMEIDTGASDADGIKGIRLPVRNVGAIQYLESSNMIYVQGTGNYGSSWSGAAPVYSGGIVSIDPDTYEVSMVIDDGDSDKHPYGNISGMGVVSAEKAYFVGYAGWGDNTLYLFNPTTGEVFGQANSYLQNKNISGMEAGTFTDGKSMLWVCNATDSEVVILNTEDNTIDEKVSTALNPTRVVFTTTTESEDKSCALLSDSLEISIPSAGYDSLSLSFNLEFEGVDDQGSFLWRLKDLTVNSDQKNSSCAQIASSLDISISCVSYSTSSGQLLLTAEFEYIGLNSSGDLIWRLSGAQFR